MSESAASALRCPGDVLRVIICSENRVHTLCALHLYFSGQTQFCTAGVFVILQNIHMLVLLTFWRSELMFFSFLLFIAA